MSLALAGATIAQTFARTNERSSVEDLLQSTGLAERAPAVATAVRGEPDPYWARIAVIRALNGEALDPMAFSGLPPRQAMADAARVGERLNLARDLAREAVADRPWVWQAPMLEGTAVYLSWSRQGSPELFTRRESWRRPLETASTLAPGRSEPRRILAAAILEIWGVLTSGERHAARPVLEAAFSDQATFDRLASLWLARASGREAAFDLVPSTVAAWLTVERLLARQRDLDAAAEARIRRRAVLAQCLDGDLENLRQRVAGGDVSGARRQLLAITEGTPCERMFAGQVAAAWQIAPAMAIDAARRGGVQAWLSWAMRGAVRGQQLLPPGVVDRLAAAVGDLDPPDRAVALLAAGRLADAEAIARRAEDLNTDRWNDYCVAAARALVQRREIPEARRLLELLPAIRRTQLPAAAVLPSDDPGGIELARLATHEWPATSWRWSGSRATLDLASDGPGDLEMTFDVVPEQGSLVEITVDFGTAWIGVVTPGAVVRVTSPGDGLEPLTLTVETAAGGRVMPGLVRLAPAVESGI